MLVQINYHLSFFANKKLALIKTIQFIKFKKKS